MATTDSKKNGRFIKKGDPLHKVLTISDFSLADICETPITFHDNASANIIHEKLHLKEELAQTVRLSHEIETVFPNMEERMLIRPLDFTEEWHRLRKRQSSRTMRTDDDEDFEIEAARAEEAKQDEDDLAAIDSRLEEEELAAEADELISAPVKETAPPPKPTPAPVQAPIMATPPPAPQVEHEPEEEEDDFVPYASQNNGQANTFSTPERGLSDEEIDQIRQEARELGFREGYQSGEERATLESRAKVQAILEEVANIVENLEGMQKSILDQAQSNFYAICKNFVESMLHKEFAMSAEVFGNFIARAANEALHEDEFKIFVSPKVAKELKAWSNDELKGRIRADESIQDFNFRVEGEHSSVDGNISKVIADLLNQADLNLFDSNKDKVG